MSAYIHGCFSFTFSLSHVSGVWIYRDVIRKVVLNVRFGFENVVRFANWFTTRI